MVGPELLVNLALTLAAGLVGGLVALRLRQSVILGYIVAGIAIGPNTPGLVGDVPAVEALADIGVILLMFTIGVELSIRDLLRVGRVALLGGGLQVAATMALGYGVGLALGWPPAADAFFGAALALSSSTVLSKVLSEHGALGAVHGRIALGWAAVQDLLLIVLVVVLSSVASGGEKLFHTAVLQTGQAVLFLLLLVPVGYRLLPRLFEQVAALRNPEVFALAVAAFALGTAYAASRFGLSAALGAFVAGIVVSESDVSHQILRSAMPLRDIFAGLFFVSVGMLVDPRIVVQHPLLLLLAVALIIPAKGAISLALTWALSYPPRTALLAGVALAQAGEFTFLLARLGIEHGVVTAEIFNLLLGAAALSIIVAPALYRAAQPAARIIERRFPVREVDKELARSHSAREQAEAEAGPRGHALICGYGRVGRLIGASLRRRGFSIAVIDQDRETALRLREQGIPAIVGSADQPLLLDRAGLARARVLVLAVPDALATREAIDYARRTNPALPIIARVESEAERDILLRQGVSAAIIGEREMAIEMTRHALRRFGVSAIETLAIVQRLRLDERARPVDRDPMLD